MKGRILIVGYAAISTELTRRLTERGFDTMQAKPDVTATKEIMIGDLKAPVRIHGRSMLERTTMMVAGIDQDKLDQHRLKQQRKLPGKPVRVKGNKGKRKQAAKSRAKNRGK